MIVYENSAAEVVARQAVPRLLEHAADGAIWPSGNSPEKYLKLDGSDDQTPEETIDAALPDLASPYALFRPEYGAFIKRTANNPGWDNYFDNAPRLVMDGFVRRNDDPWTYYFPEGYSKGPTRGRTYVTLPPDESAVDALVSVSDDIEETLRRPGIALKISRQLDEVHSIVIYDDGNELALEGLRELVDLLREKSNILAEHSVLTAFPVSRGVARAPEIPEEVMAVIPDRDISWSQVAGLLIKTSMQFALIDTEITDVQCQKDALQEIAISRTGNYLAQLLNHIGVDPITYRQL